METFQRVIDESDVVCLWGFHDGRLFQRLNWKGRTVIASAHGACSWTTQMLRALLPYCHRYTAVSQAAARTYPQALQSQVRVIYNGVNFSRLIPRQSRTATRAAWGLRPEEIAIAYVGRYAPDKNPTAAARAARTLGAPYRAVYVGSGYQEDQVHQAVRSLSPNAICVPHTPHIGDILAAIDVYLLASPSEGHCQGLCEAWGYGVPTVSTRVGATPELELRHGPLTIPIRLDANDQELAQAVITSLQPENRPLVERARIVQSQYTHHVTARNWADFLTEDIK
ncbi:MAG: glycosyltransferase family 4 protein [Bacteroidales bacterium]|nr:glycosyltransferase family 4 protein [Bacteroidales bacterium]